jgi:serine/threonine protein kinase
LYEIAQGILYLHEMKMAHGDINWVIWLRLDAPRFVKTDRTAKMNVLIDAYVSAKLADFGLAVIYETTTSGSTTNSAAKGTVAWMSPERHDAERRLKPPMDVYSFGILCYAVSRLNIVAGDIDRCMRCSSHDLDVDKNASFSRHFANGGLFESFKWRSS